MIGTSQGLVALDQHGEIVWSALNNESIVPVMVFPASELIFCGSQPGKHDAGKYYAVDSQGQMLWSTSFSQGQREMFCTRWPGACGPDGTLYLGSAAFQTNEFKLLVQTILRVKNKDDGMFGVLTALDPINGDVKWSFTADDSLEGTPAVGPDGTVYIASWDGHLYALKPPR